MEDFAPTESLRTRVLRRKASLWNERSTWDTHYRELSEFFQPDIGRFTITDGNNGAKKHGSIIDNGGSIALRTLAAGMLSGNTSPARPWFRTALLDRDLMEWAPVKAWLYKAQTIVRDIFARSNTYRTLHAHYEETGLFGTGASIMVDDFETVIHHYPLTCGEYAVATDERGVVNTLARELQMTAEQVVQRFGLKAVSQTVKNLYHGRNFDAKVPVLHLIEPRHDRDSRKADARNMPWSSIYVEAGGNEDIALRESGYRRYPGLAPRWTVTGNDTYGRSPGMAALGDNKQLQQQQLRKGQGIDYQVMPPLQVPTTYKGNARARLPGGVLYVDSIGPGGGVKSAFDVNLDLGALREDIVDVRERVRVAFYSDLFLMLANDTRSNITATEIAQRHEEKLLMLGPTLERLENELLRPLVERTFDRCVEAGIFPEPPRELQGQELSFEFIGVLSQAQRMVASQSADKLLGTVTSMAAVWPEAKFKINPLQAVDDYAEMYGVNPEIVVPDEVVQERMAAQAKAQAAQQMAAAAPAMADAAKTAGDINTDGLRDVMSQFSGYNSPPPQAVPA